MQDDFIFLNRNNFIRKARQKIFFALLLAWVIHFSSCSYQIYYPQRLTVFAFDSAHQTRTLGKPYMQILGAELGIAHSFSNHFFLSATTQLNSSLFHLEKGNIVSVQALTGAYSADVSAGVFTTNKNHNGFELALQMIHEHNQLNYHLYPNYTYGAPPLVVNKRVNYLMPSFQFAYNHFPEGKNNFYLGCRFSYALADEFRNGISLETEISESGFYNQNIFIQPGFRLELKKIPDIKLEGSVIIGLNKTAVHDYYSPVMLSVMIEPKLLKRL